MMSYYKVANWKKKELVYSYNKEGLSPSYKVRSANEEVDGFFLMVRNTPLICFTDNEKKNRLIYGSISISVDNEIDFFIKTSWPFVNTKIVCETFTLKFREFVPFMLIQNKLDPTFDWLDLSCSLFSAYIAEEMDLL